MRLFAVATFLALLSLLPPSALAQAPKCSQMELDAAVDQGRQLTTLLKIASFRGDVAYMTKLAGELEVFLSDCGDESDSQLALVCDFDCHMQLGRYRLFMASDLPLLSAAGVVAENSSISPAEMQKHAVEGQKIVERGLSFLARQQTKPPQTSPQDNAYSTFVSQLVSLSTLRSQLFMSSGDIWYQAVSEARIKHLDFLLGGALNASSGEAEPPKSNLSMAYSNYRAAMWTLVEAEIDIPDVGDFAPFRVSLLPIKAELSKRLDSVQRGYLFVGIDPLQFTTINFSDLEKQMASTREELKLVEDKIAGIVKEWHADKLGEDTRSIDEARTVRGQQINLVAHRIGTLELESKKFSKEVGREIEKLASEKDSFLFRQQIRALEVQLATKIAQFEARRAQLKARSDLDLIVLEKEAELDRRSEMRWLISWNMTRMNIEMQIASLEDQTKEYARQKHANANRSGQIKNEIGQKAKVIDIANNAIAQAELAKKQIDARMSNIYRQHRAVIREDICRIEKELAFVGSPPERAFTPIDGERSCEVAPAQFTKEKYNAEMCGDGANPGLRQKLSDARVRARAFLLQCIVGPANFEDLKPMVANDLIISGGAADTDKDSPLNKVDCGSFSETESSFATKIWELELQGLDQRRAELEKRRDLLSERIASVVSWIDGFLRTAQQLSTGVQAAEATLAALSAVPEISVHLAGLASGTSTKLDLSKAAKATVEAVRNTLDTAIKLGKVEDDARSRIEDLKSQLEGIQEQVQRTDLARAMKAIALHHAHFQLAGRRAEGLNEIKELMLQDSIADIDCQSDTLDLNSRIATLKSEHARALASLELVARENDLLNFDLQQQDFIISRAQIETAIAQQEIERLTLVDQQLSEDSAAIDDLIKDVEGRKASVAQIGQEVRALADASNQSTAILQDLKQRQEDKLLALEADEMAELERRIVEEKSNTVELVNALEQVQKLDKKNEELHATIDDFQKKIDEEATQQREEMTKLISQVDDPNQHLNLFVTTQDKISQLLQSVPEYVVTKRRLLETANMTLHLMRQRYGIVASVSGLQVNWPSTYVRNLAQLSTVVSEISNRHFFDERPINIGTAEIEIPADSGFARSIANTGKVTFEVSPVAASHEAMRKLGYLAIWEPLKWRDPKNMTLIDLLVAVDYPCAEEQRNSFVVSHEGSGMVFRPIVEGSSETAAQLQIGPSRTTQRVFFDVQTSHDRIGNILNYWESVFQVRSFPVMPGPPNDPGAILPFLGAPVIGRYSITVNAPTCSYDGAKFTLIFIYSSST